jgi:SAM-dependent methyltransferase
MSCPLCQSTVSKKIGAEFQLCSVCGLMVRSGSAEVAGLYRSGWLSPLENLNLTGGTNPALARNYTRELTRSLGINNLEGKMILDFGGGRGEMALALIDAGAKVVTVDPYSNKQLQQKGLTAVESLKQLGDGKRFDGAIAIDVIEHLTTPWDELKEIKNLLKTNGWLYLSTPNGRSLNAQVNQANWREALNPSHLLLFTPPSIEMALRKAGFEHFKRLRWNVNYSENNMVRAKDWLLRTVWLDGVLRYIASVTP